MTLKESDDERYRQNTDTAMFDRRMLFWDERTTHMTNVRRLKASSKWHEKDHRRLRLVLLFSCNTNSCQRCWRISWLSKSLCPTNVMIAKQTHNIQSVSNKVKNTTQHAFAVTYKTYKKMYKMTYTRSSWWSSALNKSLRTLRVRHHLSSL